MIAFVNWTVDDIYYHIDFKIFFSYNKNENYLKTFKELHRR